VVAIPAGLIDLDPLHRQAWERTLDEISTQVRLVPVDIAPFLAVARMLYEPALVAERLAAFGHLLEPDGPHLDPVVRAVVLRGASATAADVHSAAQRLAPLAAAARAVFAHVDAFLLPVTPGHPTHADVAADPIGVNSRLGTYTNMVNLLDLCAVAIPAGRRADELPFGVQLLAPAFADRPLLELAARLTGASPISVTLPADRALLVVCGAHLSGQPLNSQLVGLGGRLHRRARTAAGYRMYRLPGTPAKPGLVDTGDGPTEGLEVELWNLPQHGLGQLLGSVGAPLRLGPVRLDDGSAHIGFLADPAAVGTARDITASGGWRGYLASA
jgi:allophanate hydrolase